MKRLLSQHWVLLTLRGALALIFGALAIIWPDITVFVLALIFGAFALIDGVVSTVVGLTQRFTFEEQWPLLFQGVLGMAVGLTAFLWPDITTLVLLYIIAFWLVFSGFLQMVDALRLRHTITREWLLALTGAISIVGGIIMAAFPDVGIVAVGIVIGVFAIFFGVIHLSRALQERSRGQQYPRPAMET